jgi:hypothetical protein
MTDFIEIDFLEAGAKGSGDAIAIRRRRNGTDSIYIVDGGYVRIPAHLTAIPGTLDRDSCVI